MRFRAKIEKGKLKLQERLAFEGWVSGQKDGPVIVEIRRPKRIRSLPSNAYYWSTVLKYIGDHLGYTEEEAHSALGLEFRMDRTGPIPKVKSTARMEQEEFSAYIETVVRWAASFLGVVIPDPSEE